TSVAVGDFNGDGKMDLGVTSNVYNAGAPGTPGYYVYYPGWYYGSWGYHPGTPGTPPSYDGHANVLLGNGDGSFSEMPNSTDLGSGSHTAGSVAVGDFNADGKLDLGV